MAKMTTAPPPALFQKEGRRSSCRMHLHFHRPVAVFCRMKKLLAVLGGVAFGLTALGAPQTFDFKDPKSINTVVFKTDALLESNNGTATGVSGSVIFDPADPGAVKGKIVVEAASLRVPNAMMQGHLQ